MAKVAIFIIFTKQTMFLFNKKKRTSYYNRYAEYIVSKKIL